MIELSFDPNTEKVKAKDMLTQYVAEKGFIVTEENFEKPWGGYFCISDDSLVSFIDEYFPEFQELKTTDQKLSPKFLLVAPQQRLSWQYHHRRAELWKVVFGPIGVMQNETDEQTEPQYYQTGELIQLGQGTRHRLMGADNWGVVAEIWKHTDPTQPSEETDIVRVQDDYGR